MCRFESDLEYQIILKSPNGGMADTKDSKPFAFIGHQSSSLCWATILNDTVYNINLVFKNYIWYLYNTDCRSVAQKKSATFGK
jgi:hypothetical protein